VGIHQTQSFHCMGCVMLCIDDLSSFFQEVIHCVVVIRNAWNYTGQFCAGDDVIASSLKQVFVVLQPLRIGQVTCRR
jgi:hypothetical protein